jgi:transcriptional regulator with XRE-family HTH domain
MSPTELSRAADISVPYAWQILKGERTPSLAVALRIFDATGEQLGPLAGLNKRDIEGVRKAAA